MMKVIRTNSDGISLVKVTGTYKVEKISEKSIFDPSIDEVAIVDEENQKPLVYIADIPIKDKFGALDGEHADFHADAYVFNSAGLAYVIPRIKGLL